MKLEEAARRAGAALRQQASDVTPPSLHEARQASRLRDGLTLASTAFLAALVVAVALALLVGPSRNRDVADTPLNTLAPVPSSADAPPPSEVSAVAPARVWRISYPATWYRADSELMPDLGMDSLTLATNPLTMEPSRCDHMPAASLRDLGDDDALVSVFFTGAELADAPPWPATGMNGERFPASLSTAAHVCSGRDDLEVHWRPWNLDGEGIQVLVVFGADVPEERRAEVWAVVSSLEASDERTEGSACVVTKPPVPGLTPPAPYNATPSPDDLVWYGTDELWTVLAIDGSFVPTKSVWWSTLFRGGSEEPMPEISVRFDRVDQTAPTIHSEGLGTNAYTVEDGWFMMADMEQEPAGCWRVTTSYRDATLSYVVWVP